MADRCNEMSGGTRDDADDDDVDVAKDAIVVRRSPPPTQTSSSRRACTKIWLNFVHSSCGVIAVNRSSEQ
jgi:hypothetical protein